MKYISFCLPTNGVSEWVFPVLDSIYNQKTNLEEWELIVTNNGDNKDFHIKMLSYEKRHKNLTYKKTNSVLFNNQIDALTLASGTFLKLLNHRMLLKSGSIDWMVDLIKKNLNDKPVIYLSNGALKTKTQNEYDTFDGFVRGLGEFASWTTGVGVWKTDFDNIPKDFKYNSISPHSDVLFFVKNRDRYIINDFVWGEELDNSHKNKGHYDLYKAFCIDEIEITNDLFRNNHITKDTFCYVVKRYEKLVASFYLCFNILHMPCSYDISSFNSSTDIYINKKRVIFYAYLLLPKTIIYFIIIKFYSLIKGGKNV